MSDAPPFRRVLVANRGEIAVRVFRTLRDMGIESVAVYSDADRDALHVRIADHAFHIGPATPAESYLDIDRVLDAAKQSGAEAIHPGYGFLAENATFAERCAEAGIAFIGPPASAISSMGSKTASRELMRKAGVPIIPGTTEVIESPDQALAVAREVGFPVAFKARSGGGGKGFRVALDEGEVAAAFEGASGEGARYFSDPGVYVERYLAHPRHVEVQLLADTQGTTLHLGERDCTIQRRHQKLVEESPSPAVDSELRAKLAEIAIGAARAVGYTSAGTVECLLDQSGQAYFLEMNTRVQVEHTITEEVTGIDIVAEQVRIAAGLPLSFAQDDVEFRGHAIECRINAEDARHDFRPSSGTVTAYTEPSGPGVRIDSGVRAGSEVSPFYDNLVAKLVTWGRDREHARRRMLRALGELRVDGIETLIPFHRALLADAAFIDATDADAFVADPGTHMDAAGEFATPTPASDTATDGDAAPVQLLVPASEHVVEVDGHRFTVGVFDRVTPRGYGKSTALTRGGRSGGGTSNGTIAAPIPGTVIKVNVEAGASVSAGDVLCIVEAMKMENEIVAPQDGTVSDVAVQPGTAVAGGQLLMQLELTSA